MIRENELLEAIAECQGERNPNANTCIKLAAYYTILNEIRGTEPESEPGYGYSYDAPREYESGSEFGKLVEGKDLIQVMGVLDEMVMTLKLFNPRLYDATMRKLAAL